MQYFPLAVFKKRLIIVTIKDVCDKSTGEFQYQEIFFSDYHKNKLETYSYKRGDNEKKKLSYYKADCLSDLDSYNMSIAPLIEWHHKTERKTVVTTSLPT